MVEQGSVTRRTTETSAVNPATSACLLAPTQVVFASLENVTKQIYDPLLQRRGLRSARFRSLGFRFHLAFRGGSSTSSHKWGLLLRLILRRPILSCL